MVQLFRIQLRFQSLSGQWLIRIRLCVKIVSIPVGHCQKGTVNGGPHFISITAGGSAGWSFSQLSSLLALNSFSYSCFLLFVFSLWWEYVEAKYRHGGHRRQKN
jgi:hypothetical protein